MSDRLTELQRQRALVQEHLGWLEREIARELGQPAAPAAAPLPTQATPVPAAAAPTAPAPAPAPANAEQAAAEILARYQQESPGSMAKDARKGCILWFVFAMGMMAIFAVSAYFLYVSTRGRSEGDPPAAVAP